MVPFKIFEDILNCRLLSINVDKIGFLVKTRQNS